MLQPPARQQYQEFKQALLQLLKAIATDNPDGALLKENFQACQQLFQYQIASLNDDNLDPSDISRWQSFQTEAHRLIRLLEMDVMFLQASRRSATVTSRVAAMSDRIKSLIDFCEVILQKK